MLVPHLGVSENVVYPEKPNGFADHYPTKNGYFIGGIAHFQTYPNGLVFPSKKTVQIESSLWLAEWHLAHLDAFGPLWIIVALLHGWSKKMV